MYNIPRISTGCSGLVVSSASQGVMVQIVQHGWPLSTGWYGLLVWNQKPKRLRFN